MPSRHPMYSVQSLCFFYTPLPLHTQKSKQGIDALIDISGYSYHDEGVERIINVLSGIRSSDKMIYKNYFMPQAWGKFTNMASKYWIKKLHAQSTLFYARDEISFTYLRDSCIDVQNIRRAPDIAFLFRGSDIAVGAAILSKRGFPPPHRPMIGVVPNVRVYERTAGRGTGNDYLKVLEALVRFSIEKLDVNVVLLPNDCMLPGDNHTDDRFLCSLLYSRLDCADRVLVLTDDHRAEEIKAIIGNLDFLISSRFHSLVFALSQSVPVLALGWSHKYPELLSLFGLERYLISHETIHMHNSLDLLQSAWREKDILSEKIQRVLPQIESAARKVFDDVAESLCA